MAKPIISKEDFTNYITDIQKGLKRREEFNDALDKIADGWPVITLGEEWLNISLDVLSKIFKDEDIPLIGTTISWWLFEDVEKIIYDGDKEISVRTPEELYDYLIANYEEENCV